MSTLIPPKKAALDTQHCHESSHPEPWLTLKECAAQLRMSYESLRVLAHGRRVPFVDVGNGDRLQPRFRISEVEKALTVVRRSA